jgi:hypothetical protein
MPPKPLLFLYLGTRERWLMPPHEDMIDFPVSNTWQDHYYDLGLTLYPSPEYKSRSEVRIEEHMRQWQADMDKFREEMMNKGTYPRPQPYAPMPKAITPPKDTSAGFVQHG